MGQRTSFNRTREAGHLDEIQGGVANTLNGDSGKRWDIDGQAEGRMSGSERVNLHRNRAVGFINWLDAGFGDLPGPAPETARVQSG